VWKRETETEKRQTAGAAAGGRVTTKGSVRQSSENDRSRDTENRGEDGARGRLLFFITFICFIIPEPNTKQDPACIARDRACDCCKCVLVIISSFFLSLSEPISGICANQHCTADEGRERKTVMQRERERERERERDRENTDAFTKRAHLFPLLIAIVHLCSLFV